MSKSSDQVVLERRLKPIYGRKKSFFFVFIHIIVDALALEVLHNSLFIDTITFSSFITLQATYAKSL